MAIYAITGKLGSGKSLVTVGRIREYLLKKRKVATNLDLHLEKLINPRFKTGYIRLPDVPSISDLQLLGKAHNTVDESQNGLLVLDECGVFFNSREWGDKGRQAVISWLLHSRKLGWDVILIVQDLSIIDKQIRSSLVEHVGICKRLDRIGIPIIGSFLSMFGFSPRLPRMHLCTVKYGTEQHSLVVDRWIYRGTTLQDGYDTLQIFSAMNDISIHSVLPPWLSHGRYLDFTLSKRIKKFLQELFNLSDPKRDISLYKEKHPLIIRIMKLKNPQLRIEFMKRFEQCNAFS